MRAIHFTRDDTSSSNLKLRKFNFPGFDKTIVCDEADNVVRPFVPTSLRKFVFDSLHKMSHPGVKATVELVKSRYVWLGLRKDVGLWVKSCLSCQKSKISRHSRTAIGMFDIPSNRFSHINIDLVG